MKKLITGAIAAAALLFGFASCSGDLHDDVAGTPVNLDGYYLVGSMTNWNNNNAALAFEGSNYSYTVDFTASGSSDQFSFIAKKGSWDVQIGGDKILAGTGSDDGITYEYADNGNGGYNGVFKGLTAGATYKMTIDSSAGIKVSINATTAKATPVPYYLDGMFLVGGVFKTTGNENAYNFSTENLLWGATTDNQTGVVTYTKDITAIAASGEMAINDSTWNNKQGGEGITVKGDNVPVALSGNAGNFKVEGLTVGSPYRVTITTTPEKKVSVSIKAIVRYTITFEITGLSEGNAAWINGAFWGSSWPNGWPITDWKSTPNETLAAAIPEANSGGVATFAAAWNVTNIADPGADLSFEFKAIATTSKDTWDTEAKADKLILNPSSNMSCEIEDVEAATYKVSIDAETEEVTVTKL